MACPNSSGSELIYLVTPRGSSGSRMKNHGIQFYYPGDAVPDDAGAVNLIRHFVQVRNPETLSLNVRVAVGQMK